MRKILVFVYRNGNGDSTNNGVTSKKESMLLFSDATVEEIINYCKEKNIDPKEQLMLNKRILWGEPQYYAEPVIKKEGLQMNGGNFVYTTHSGYLRMTGSTSPISVHDRFESQAQYDALSI